MAVALYMDVHSPGDYRRAPPPCVGVLTAQEDGADRLDDGGLLDQSTTHDRTSFTFDDSLLCEAGRWQSSNIPFTGVAYAHFLCTSMGSCIDDLALVARVAEPNELRNQVLFLPL